VLVHYDGTCLNWKLAIVEGLAKGNDGIVRSTTIRTQNGIANRPVLKLYPLKVAASDATSIWSQVTGKDNIQEDREETTNELTDQHVNNHPKRGAAEWAWQQILEWTECICAPEDVGDYTN